MAVGRRLLVTGARRERAHILSCRHELERVTHSHALLQGYTASNKATPPTCAHSTTDRRPSSDTQASGGACSFKPRQPLSSLTLREESNGFMRSYHSEVGGESGLVWVVEAVLTAAFLESQFCILQTYVSFTIEYIQCAHKVKINDKRTFLYLASVRVLLSY